MTVLSRLLLILGLMGLGVAPAQAQVDAATGEVIMDGPSMVEPLRQFSSEENQTRYYRLTWELRCPLCDHQAIADSNAPISADMRNRVAAMIESGYSDREIVDFMIERWGEGVTFRPRMGLHTAWIWVAGVLAGGFLIAVILGVRMKHAGGSRDGDNTALTSQEEAQLKRLRETNKAEDS